MTPRQHRKLRDDALDHVDHALGRPHDPLAKSYRNYFVVSADSPLEAEMDASPWWEREGVTPGGRLVSYVVTDAGRAALAAHLTRNTEAI